MLLIEIIAVIFTAICVYLSVKNNVHLWWTGIIGIIFYAILFWNTGLYADLLLQGIFMYQSIKGWYLWVDTKDKPAIQITSLSLKEMGFYLLSTLTLYVGIYSVIIYFNPSIPLVDSLTSALSVVGNWLLMKRKIQNWLFWIVADAIYVPLYLYKDLYFSSVLYFIFLILAIEGYFNWKKEYDKEKTTNTISL